MWIVVSHEWINIDSVRENVFTGHHPKHVSFVICLNSANTILNDRVTTADGNMIISRGLWVQNTIITIRL